jgi:hypothetical protein
VVPAFEAGAVKLTIRPRGRGALHTDTLAREGGGTGPSFLSRNAQTVLDVARKLSDHGARREGNVAGLAPCEHRSLPEPLQRIYDARLSGDLDDTVLMAMTLALNDEADWIERHAIDVYRGKHRRQPRTLDRPR